MMEPAPSPTMEGMTIKSPPLGKLEDGGGSGWDKRVRFDDKIEQAIATEQPEVDKMMSKEEKKELVYEVKPYFSHSVLQATMFLYVIWNVMYLFYRGAWTLNTETLATLIFSALFLFVEVLSFFTTTLHFNNFTNPQTNIMLQKLPDILAKQKKEYPPIATFICCYKEPQHIVSRTIGYVKTFNNP